MRRKELRTTVSAEAARSLPQHDVFEVYVDLIPDTVELTAFDDAFGFTPPAEPLLNPVFEDGYGQPLSEFVSWDVSEGTEIVPPELLAAMKIRSLPDRDKSHKRVKDVADLHALLWYTKPYEDIREQVREFISEDDLQEMESAVTGTENSTFEDAGTLLQIDSETIQSSIVRLT